MARRRPRAGDSASKGSGRRRPTGDAIEELRLRIDAIDRKMVRLLNERAGCAIALGRVKKERGLPIYQPAREEEVLSNVRRASGGPLNRAASRGSRPNGTAGRSRAGPPEGRAASQDMTAETDPGGSGHTGERPW